MKQLGCIGLIVIIAIALFVTPIIVQYNHKQEFTGEITDKYNKRDGDSDKFYVVLDDKTIVQNSDLLFKGRFNSADVQAQLKVGDKVKIKTIGYRIQILSMYPQMYDVKQMEEK